MLRVTPVVLLVLLLLLAAWAARVAPGVLRVVVPVALAARGVFIRSKPMLEHQVEVAVAVAVAVPQVMRVARVAQAQTAILGPTETQVQAQPQVPQVVPVTRAARALMAPLAILVRQVMRVQEPLRVALAALRLRHGQVKTG